MTYPAQLRTARRRRLGTVSPLRRPACPLTFHLIALIFVFANPANIFASGSDPYAAGLEAFQNGKPAEALPLFQEAARLRPQNALVANALGNTWLTLNEPAKARQEYLRAITLDPRLLAAHKNLGILEYHQGRFPAAERQLSAVTATAPQDAVAWRFLGLSLDAGRRPKDALIPLQRALALDPENAEVRLDLARVEASGGLPEAALSDYRRLVSNRALEPNGQKAVGLALAALGDSADAIVQFQFILESHPADEAVAETLAREYLRTQQPDLAIATLQSALSKATDKADLYNLLGWLYQQAGHGNEAENSYRNAILADPKRPEPYLRLSWLFAEFHHFDDGAQTLREGLRFVPDPFSLQLQLSTILVLGGHEQEALPILQKVIAAQPHNPAGYTTLIIDYTLLNPSFDRPLQAAEQAIKECPNDYLSHYLYGGLLFRKYRQEPNQSWPAPLVERIKSELRESIRLNGDFPHSYYDLARLEFETGHYPAAEHQALAALHTDKDFSEARYLLGRIYIKEGRKEEGQAQIAQVEQQHEDDIRHVATMGQELLAKQAAATGSLPPAVSGANDASLSKTAR